MLPRMPWADLLSLSRLPLGVLFFTLARSASLGMLVITVAAVTDVLDGWVARRASATRTQVDFSRVHAPTAREREKNTQVDFSRGDWLDPLCDKLFVGFVLAGLVWHFGAPWRLVLLLLLREWLQLASITIYALAPRLRKHGRYNYRANNLGKATTVLQFLTALVILFGTPAPWGLAGVTAALGVCSLATYIARVVPKAAG